MCACIHYYVHAHGNTNDLPLHKNAYLYIDLVMCVIAKNTYVVRSSYHGDLDAKSD